MVSIIVALNIWDMVGKYEEKAGYLNRVCWIRGVCWVGVS